MGTDIEARIEVQNKDGAWKKSEYLLPSGRHQAMWGWIADNMYPMDVRSFQVWQSFTLRDLYLATDHRFERDLDELHVWKRIMESASGSDPAKTRVVYRFNS